MIDIENKVIDTLAEAYTGTAKVTGAYPEFSETFPLVYARETSNSTYTHSLDNDLHDHHATVTFRLEYFSNKASGAKQEVKALAQIGDVTMQGMKFRRTSFSFIPNDDRSVVRAYADYRAVVGEPREIGNDVVYQMYR